MNSVKKLKIFNDPIYGFITIPNVEVFNLIEHKYFQRLRRISQMGLSYLVYPGAHHTRFHHALGSMHLMQKAVNVLRFKDVTISNEEESALYMAILLHDIGHGPFSHAMENSIVSGTSHEDISLRFMQKLNDEFNGSLTLAIELFKGTYPKKFMCQLISSQLDMDRADYLKRDSFYAGVAEGNINSERLISMLTVFNNQLVIEKKGIYSAEKFLIARRFMYWQVYLHKTSLVAEQLLIRVLKRAKYLASNGEQLQCSVALNYFLTQEKSLTYLDDEALEVFSKLDDYDIVSAIKNWENHSDFVLKTLCSMILNRSLLKIKIRDTKFSRNDLNEPLKKVMKAYNLSEDEAGYFVFKGEIFNLAYQTNTQNINVLVKSNKVKDITKVSDHLNLKALSKPVTKYYKCVPKIKM
ncbi:MAG: HD domain-containing protein [Winogradskyella sp.]|nr:HD domain-containing protein [Winogradskyella sp.]MBT8375579.1 HD domain-containing protein [Bacteroidia bacterium]NNC46455.1 HD domain-containing protein [Winogradskyella sp.]NNF84997.1 HD domain-containing protein [Winogradskyella sp.]NNL82997.1 HD domain-containing protein [Winogradskyella sp.]